MLWAWTEAPPANWGVLALWQHHGFRSGACRCSHGMVFPEGLRLNPLGWGEAEVSPQGWVKSSGMSVKRWCLWLSSAGHSILPQQRVAAAANPAGNGELTLAAGSSLEERCLQMCDTSVQVLLATFMAEVGKCFLSSVVALLLAGGGCHCWQPHSAADVHYTWPAAKPDQAETLKKLQKISSFVLLSLTSVKTAAFCEPRAI